MAELINTTEIAVMFEVDRRQISRWKYAHASFPRPVPKGPGQLYSREEVIEWGILTRRWDDEVGRPIDDWKRCPCCDNRTRSTGRPKCQ
jgi:hypothetical protein